MIYAIFIGTVRFLYPRQVDTYIVNTMQVQSFKRPYQTRYYNDVTIVEIIVIKLIQPRSRWMGIPNTPSGSNPVKGSRISAQLMELEGKRQTRQLNKLQKPVRTFSKPT